MVLIGVVGLAWGGQLLGGMFGARVRSLMPFETARYLDHALGAVAGMIAVSLVVWFIGGALSGSPSTAVRQSVTSSRVLSVINTVVPSRLSVVADGFRSIVAGSGFPRVFAGMGPEQIVEVAPPNNTAMSSKTLAKVRLSIVKITGNALACQRGQEGSGAVVAGERVITNAHVVAGVRRPSVQVGGKGRLYPATVVLFDPQRDVAILAVPGLPAPALTLGTDLTRADDAVVAGFPENGPFVASPARVRSVLTATGEDIYGHAGVRRQVYSLYAQVQPGNSGGPVMTPDGSLAGVVFAKSLDSPITGYALTLSEVRSDLNTGIAATSSVDTKGCSVG
jgi:S1-C subfamily serine protease